MFVAFSSSIVIVREEVHVFTNPRPFGPCQKPMKLEWELNQVFQNALSCKIAFEWEVIYGKT